MRLLALGRYLELARCTECLAQQWSAASTPAFLAHARQFRAHAKQGHLSPSPSCTQAAAAARSSSSGAAGDDGYRVPRRQEGSPGAPPTSAYERALQMYRDEPIAGLDADEHAMPGAPGPVPSAASSRHAGLAARLDEIAADAAEQRTLEADTQRRNEQSVMTWTEAGVAEERVPCQWQDIGTNAQMQWCAPLYRVLEHASGARVRALLLCVLCPPRNALRNPAVLCSNADLVDQPGMCAGTSWHQGHHWYTRRPTRSSSYTLCIPGTTPAEKQRLLS